MRLLALVAALVAALVVGVLTGVATIAVHRSVAGLALGLLATVVVMWTLRLWLGFAATAFAAGWLLPLLVAITGRAEGDYVVSGDLLGWGVIVSGLVVLVTGVAWGRPRAAPRDSGSSTGST